eukprot:XP_016665007.1 PREDICTED: nucleolar complex protein 2 homolog [Acyrthosiphon pisum]
MMVMCIITHIWDIFLIANLLLPNALPGINFMRQSLSEVFTISESVSYNHAFLYIRQLAIHLRSTVTLKKKNCGKFEKLAPGPLTLNIQ